MAASDRERSDFDMFWPNYPSFKVCKLFLRIPMGLGYIIAFVGVTRVLGQEEH